MEYAVIIQKALRQRIDKGKHYTFSPYQWWSEQATKTTEVYEDILSCWNEEFCSPDELLAQRGFIVLSSEEWEAFVLPEVAARKKQQEDADEQKRLECVLAALEEEKEFLHIAQQKYPLGKMEEELERNPSPTFVQALERGVSWSPCITGDGSRRREMEDGSIASSTLGALLIGCYGLNVEIPSRSRALHEMLVERIKHLKTKSGRERKCINSYLRLQTASGRGVRHEESLWLKRVDNDGCVARSSHLDLMREFDRKLLISVQEDCRKFSSER